MRSRSHRRCSPRSSRSRLRHLGAERVPGLERFVDAERLAPEDGAGRATASLAAAALARLAGDGTEAVAGFRRAATAYAELGFPLDAAHAFHLAGDAEDARALYLRCGAVGYARETQSGPPSLLSPRGWPLSEREQAVAELVTQGFTNVGIAERMSVSPKTVEKYLASIFRKLGLRSRSQIAARLVDREVAAR